MLAISCTLRATFTVHAAQWPPPSPLQTHPRSAHRPRAASQAAQGQVSTSALQQASPLVLPESCHLLAASCLGSQRQHTPNHEPSLSSLNAHAPSGVFATHPLLVVRPLRFCPSGTAKAAGAGMGHAHHAHRLECRRLCGQSCNEAARALLPRNPADRRPTVAAEAVFSTVVTNFCLGSRALTRSSSGLTLIICIAGLT